MKKLITLAKTLGVLLLGSASLTASAFDLIPLQFGTEQTMPTQGSGAIFYTPNENGQLTLNFGDPGNSGIVYTGMNGEDPVGSPLKLNSNSDEATGLFCYYLRANVTYYISEYLYAPRKFTASFQPGEYVYDGPLFSQLQTLDWEMCPDINASPRVNEYRNFSWITDASTIIDDNPETAIQGPSTCLTFTPNSNGTLTVYQNTSDGHLYTLDWDLTSTFDTYGNGLNTTGHEIDKVANSFVFIYKVQAGKTYYYYAKQEAADNLTYMFATFEASSETYKEIKVGVPFNSYNEVMTYTAPGDGMLTITAECPWNYQWTDINGAGLLFSDLGHQTKILLECADKTTTSPSVYQVAVKKDVTYYLYNSTIPNCQFTFSWAELGDIALVSVEPEPGIAYDANANYATGVYLAFSPQNVQFPIATVTYTPAGQTQETTVTLDPNAGVGENSDMEFENGKWKFRAVSKYYAMSARGTYTTLTLKGANFDGIAVTQNATGYQSVTVNDGTITVSWYLPETPVEIVSQSWPEVIYSNSTEGDPNMMATVTFNEAIKSVPSASMVFGYQYYGSGSSGDSADPGMDLPSYVSGNTLTIDMSGIDFGALMATHETSRQYSQITVFVGNIICASGQTFNDENPGIAERINYENTPAPELEYMDATPTLVYDDENAAAPIVTIYWNEGISPVVAGQALTGKLTTPDEQTVGVELTLSTYGNFDGYNALVGNLANVIQTYGAGDYTLSIGTLVKNAAGEVNSAFEDTFTVEIQITLSSIEPTISYSADQILVNWDKMPLSLYNPGDDYIYISNSDESKVYELSIANKYVAIVDNNVVIYIQNLELVDDEEYTLFIPAYYFYIGEGLECNDEVEDTFTYDSSKVNSIISEDMLNQGVYNIQGMKVNSNNLRNGIYIINGKKVVIRK